MAQTKIHNPGRLALVNPAKAKLAKKQTGTKKNPAALAQRKPLFKKRNPSSLPSISALAMKGVAGVAGAVSTVYIASKIPFGTSPFLNIVKKFSVAYALTLLTQNFKWTAPYSEAVAIGGFSAATIDAAKLYFPGLRTILVPARQSDDGSEDLSDYGMDEFGDIVEVNEFADVVEVEQWDGMSDIIDVGDGQVPRFA